MAKQDSADIPAKTISPVVELHILNHCLNFYQSVWHFLHNSKPLPTFNLQSRGESEA